MKLIFLDIDGTLTVAGENTPPDSALKAIKNAQEAGNKVFLCTGRNLDMLSPLLRYGFDGVIGISGGYVAVGKNEPYKVLFDCPMDDSVRDKTLEVLHKNGVFCTLEAKDATWGDENIGEFLEGQNEGNSEIERWRKALSESLSIKPMSDYDGRPVYKIVIMCLKLSQLDEAKELLEKDFNFCIQEVPEHGCVNGELINRCFDKGRGVELIRKYYGVDTADTYGFGDSMNDLEMIKAAGHGICMENGSKELKKHADYICPSVQEDGLYKAFEKYELTK